MRWLTFGRVVGLVLLVAMILAYVFVIRPYEERVRPHLGAVG